ncbi:Aspartic proteinase CDR1 [Linum grandiflorum]
MATSPIIRSSLVIVTIICCFVANSEAVEFSIDLIHRDSPSSPLYNPHETSYQRLEKALNRSINRINRLNSNRLGTRAGLITDIGGDYLMNISIGTPPFRILGIADTGSDITWMQCSSNNKVLFNPALSSTYKLLACQTETCANWDGEGAFCARSDGVCNYRTQYVDQSHSVGDIAFETLTLDTSVPGRTVSFPNTLIGCAYDVNMTFGSVGSGIVGFGGGPASLINQLGRSIGWKLSYCFPVADGDNKPKSTINFGESVTGYGVVSTPLIYDPSRPYYYFLRMEAISVGNVRIPFRGSIDNDKNIVIDSGTTITALPPKFFSQLLSEVERQMAGRKKVPDPLSFFRLCYEPDPAGLNVPPITVHFLGADVKLSQSNVFVKLGRKVTCFAFHPTKGDSFYGNVAQENFLIGYDLQKKTVSFKPADCGPHHIPKSFVSNMKISGSQTGFVLFLIMLALCFLVRANHDERLVCDSGVHTRGFRIPACGDAVLRNAGKASLKAPWSGLPALALMVLAFAVL